MTDWSVMLRRARRGGQGGQVIGDHRRMVASSNDRARARRRALLVAVWLPALAGCAGLVGPPRVVLGSADLARLLDRQFPQDRRLLEVFDVTLQAPRVQLQPERNRLAAVLDLGVRERVLGGRWSGQLAFDSALRWEPRDRTLRLHQARVADLKLVSAGAEVRTVAERLGAQLIERVLEDLVLYTLTAERAEALRAAGMGAADVAAVAVTARGVEITFSPAAR